MLFYAELYRLYLFIHTPSVKKMYKKCRDNGKNTLKTENVREKKC